MKSQAQNKLDEFYKKSIASKLAILGAAEVMQGIHQEHCKILKVVGKGQIVGVLGDYAVVKTDIFDDAPYQCVVFYDAEWRSKTGCWPTVEQALLDGIAIKHEGDCNSNFAFYAYRMLKPLKGDLK